MTYQNAEQVTIEPIVDQTPASKPPLLSRVIAGASLVGLCIVGSVYFVPKGMGLLTGTEMSATTDDWEAYHTIVQEGTDSGKYAYTSTVEYAQCWTGMCTLNDDGYTASCGCLAFRPSDTYEAKLKLGWSSAVLAKSSAYAAAVEVAYSSSDTGYGTDDDMDKIIADAIADKTIYADYNFKKGNPDRISMNSKADEYLVVKSTKCTQSEGNYVAQCMGAPCWDEVYSSKEGFWNTTCLCTYQHKYDAITKSNVYDDECETAVYGGAGCAVIGNDFQEYSTTELEKMITALEDATIQIDSESCPID